MQCSRCPCVNLPDAGFCQECGARLELRCASCQTEYTPGAKFCRKCGVRLGGPAAAPVLPANLPPDHHVPAHLAQRYRLARAAQMSQGGERKIITALFADIKGSMALLDGMDPELARQVIDPALKLMMNAVYRYEGYVAQALGDGIFAFFGAPIAREDHARRALYAALSMQEQMKAYSVRLLQEHGLPAMQIRVGINTGEVVVRSIATDDERADYMPIGHSTGLAARIENSAAPGTVVVSESTHRLTEGYFEFHNLGTIPLKGVSQQVPLYEVTGIGPLRTRLEVSASHGLARFVGRQQELEQMHALLEQAQGGQGQVISLIGEAGVGKSRLCHEFKLLARGECLILECNSDSYGKAFPFLPLIDMLKHYLQIDPADDDRRKLEKVTGRVLALDRDLDDSIPFLLALLGVSDPAATIDKMDPQIKRGRTFDTLQRLVLREAQNQTVVVVMEDLHWLDEESQAFLTQFARAVEGARILLLVNYRPEYQPRWDAGTAHHPLRLKAFGPEEADALLGALLGADPGLAALKRLIIDKTQGNPFFMEEYVQTLFDQKILLRGDKVVLARALSSIDMPATVQGVLAARIDRLEPEYKAFLQLLAVLGNASPLRLVERVSPHAETRLQQILDGLQSAEFIYQRPSFPDVEFVFKHALTRETAYSELLADSRRHLHSRAAQAMEAHYSDRLDDHCSELAHHYACSDNRPKAVEFLQRAGAQSMQRSAYAAAIGHLLSALALLPGLADVAVREAHELQLQSMLGSSFMATQGFAVREVATAYERALELCRDSTASADLVSVLSGLGLYYVNRGELRLARDIGEQLLGLAERRQEGALFVSGHELLGLTLLRAGDLIEGRSHLEQAVRRYGDGRDSTLRDGLGRDPAVSCLGFGAMGLWLLGYPDQAVAGAAQATRAAHAAVPRHPFSLAYAMLSTLWVHQFRGEASFALLDADATVEFAIEQGFPAWLSHGLIVSGWAAVELGRSEQGLERIEQGLRAYEQTGATVWRPLFLLLHTQALLRAGRGPEALATVTRALELAQAMGPYWWTGELHRVQGELLLATGVASAEQLQQAQACFEQALRVAREQGAKSLELRAAVSLARLAGSRGRPSWAAEALQVLEAVYGWFSEGLDTTDLTEARDVLDALR